MDKPKCTVPSDKASNHKKCKTANRHVCKVDHSRHKEHHIELSVKVVQGVDPHIHSHTASCKETSPPPSIVFSAELKVHNYDGDLSACDEKNSKYHDEKSVHVVELIHPNRSHDNVDLHKDCTERKHTGNRNGDIKFQIPWYVGNGSRIRRHSCGWFVLFLFERKECTEKC